MNDRDYIDALCGSAREASRFIAKLSTNEKNGILKKIAAGLREKADWIVAQNALDLDAAGKAGVSSALYDRLLLNRERIDGMAKSVEEIAGLTDPVGLVENMRVMPSGIRVGQMRVPLGVVAVIYEARPNVTTDIAALCVKSGNAAILRGGKEAIHSNIALHSVISDALESLGYPAPIVSFVDRTDRALVTLLLKMNRHIDIVVPRGGTALIEMVTAESTIPVIKHDKGVCHTCVDMSAEPDMAVKISLNAKVQRPGVCNAMETLLVHRDFPGTRDLLRAMMDSGVELHGCPRSAALFPDRIKPATEDDWYAEYLELICAVRVVDSLDEAMEHIMKYGSGHSETIITENYSNAERFLREVDSAAVFVNASTRFHDGGEFGLGAEVGISTQKLHARGAMGIEGLTCLKYVVYGTGQVRQ
jgi:glutamate-5-semialdehyde dehydrogenase